MNHLKCWNHSLTNCFSILSLDECENVFCSWQSVVNADEGNGIYDIKDKTQCWWFVLWWTLSLRMNTRKGFLGDRSSSRKLEVELQDLPRPVSRNVYGRWMLMIRWLMMAMVIALLVVMVMLMAMCWPWEAYLMSIWMTGWSRNDEDASEWRYDAWYYFLTRIWGQYLCFCDL